MTQQLLSVEASSVRAVTMQQLLLAMVYQAGHLTISTL
jgi:hypothetical protein